MYSVRLLTTSDRDQPAPAFGITWERLTDVVRLEVSSEAAAIFAEPIADPVLGLTYWHVTSSQDAVPFAQLSAAERSALASTLDRHRSSILKLADNLSAAGGEADTRLATALSAAVEVPDLEGHLWSVDKRPVIAAWGRQAGSAAPLSARIETRQRQQPVQSASAEEAAAAVSPLPVVVRSPQRVSLWPWLWVLFGLLAGAIYYQLLAACAVNLPLLRPALDRCPFTATEDLQPLIDRNNALRAEIREAELKAATAQADCRPEAPQEKRPDAPQEKPQQGPDTKEVEKRVEGRGSHGRLDITLAWNGREDLDLHVACPGGRLFYSQPQACAGSLEIDENKSAASAKESPIEHATWAQEPPPGEYVVIVRLYSRHGMSERPIPFTVVVTLGDKVNTFTGTATTGGQDIEVTRLRR